MRSLLATALAAFLVTPSAALAAGSGGAAAPDTPGAPVAQQPQGGNGGATFGDDTLAPQPTPQPEPKSKRRAKPSPKRAPRPSGRPLLTLFQVGPSSLFAYGPPAQVKFAIRDRSASVRVKLQVISKASHKVVRTLDLGDRPTGPVQSYSFSGGDMPQGSFQLKLSARDPGGRRLRASAKASNVDDLSFHGHRFPLIGNFDYGRSPDGRFGAPREGHTHQGQDIAAPEGTDVVAPRGGRIEYVDYQAGGAGHYVVLDGDGEDRDYAFMHLKEGSIVVKPGQHVLTGERLGEVGSTGESTGPHLHFEVWEGGHWWAGGKPVDPLPYLHRWDSWS